MAKKELSMRTVLVNSICYPALMMSNSEHDEKQMRKEPDFIANMANFTRNRWRSLFRSCNTDNVLEPRYVG
jgi:hypothetical protein